MDKNQWDEITKMLLEFGEESVKLASAINALRGYTLALEVKVAALERTQVPPPVRFEYPEGCGPVRCGQAQP